MGMHIAQWLPKFTSGRYNIHATARCKDINGPNDAKCQKINN